MRERGPISTYDEDDVMYSNPQGESVTEVGTIHVDRNPSPIGLMDRAYGYLKKFPEITEQAKEKKKKLVAFASSHGGTIAVGTFAATVGIAGAFELYRYKKHDKGIIKKLQRKKR